jgi:hypothetical protein
MEMIYLSVNYILLGEESVFQKIVLLKIKLGLIQVVGYHFVYLRSKVIGYNRN